VVTTQEAGASVDGARESGALRGVFDVERFSLGGLLQLVGHEMQHRGQQSEAGGCKRDGHERELKAWRLDSQIIRNDGCDRPTPRQALCEIRSEAFLTVQHVEDPRTTLLPAVTGDAFGHASRYPRLGKRAAWYAYAEKSRAHARSVFSARSRWYCGSES